MRKEASVGNEEGLTPAPTKRAQRELERYQMVEHYWLYRYALELSRQPEREWLRDHGLAVRLMRRAISEAENRSDESVAASATEGLRETLLRHAPNETEVRALSRSRLYLLSWNRFPEDLSDEEREAYLNRPAATRRALMRSVQEPVAEELLIARVFGEEELTHADASV